MQVANSTLGDPMNLDLSSDEALVLLRALDAYLPELDFDTARVKLERERHEIANYGDSVRRVRDRLAQLIQGATKAA